MQEKWLSDDEQNMAAVHCKAGKGRAGMMICCWLLHSGVAATADEAMTKYAEIRTKDAKVCLSGIESNIDRV